MNFLKKFTWIFSILLIFSLIAITNMMDRNRFTIIKDAVISIYEDRLVAKNIVVELSHSFYEKEIASASSDTVFFENKNKSVNRNIDELIIKFQRTKLTSAEEEAFANLQTNFNRLRELENETSFISGENKIVFNSQIDRIQKNLADLSSIQLQEGKRQLVISKKAVEEIELFTKAENVMLILLAILSLIILFIYPKKKDKKDKKEATDKA